MCIDVTYTFVCKNERVRSIGTATHTHTRALSHTLGVLARVYFIASFLCVIVLINLNIYCYPILTIIIGSACLLCSVCVAAFQYRFLCFFLCSYSFLMLLLLAACSFVRLFDSVLALVALYCTITFIAVA